MSIITLIGYMGSGKSTVSKKVAKRLNFEALDLDEYIESQENKSINDIFKEKGEIYFRKQERFYLDQILREKKNLVLALGGGTPCYGDNMSLILKYSKSVYLRAHIPTLVSRLSKEQDLRPLIASLDKDQLSEFVAKHLFERRSFYEQSHFTVVIDQKTVEEITEEICLLI
ncbi:shikimate kinase [Namhaeicola litoreus]|uniref:Shikimate kinase n=1 Tax=Namhaeicola litoreus TaxID=1052145 RepID=A0ABW3Y2R7_9FLAO